MTPSPSSLLWRCCFYVLAVALAALVPRLEFLQANTEQLFTETSALEHISLGLLFLMICIYAYCALRYRHWRSICATLSLLCLGALTRELDYFLDAAVADGGWQVLVTCVLLAVIVIISRDRDRFRRNLVRFSKCRAFGILLSAFLTIAVFSRLFGMSTIWESTLVDSYNRSAKNLAEEGVELLGYALLFIGTVEARLWFSKRRTTALTPQNTG